MKPFDKTISTKDNIKMFRWLFCLSLFPILVLILVPVLMVPLKILPYLEMLAALTVGVLFAAYFLSVNILGFFADKQRKRLYIGMIVLMSAWILWAVISWAYIEHMDYLLH
jgi:hypothetical protein